MGSATAQPKEIMSLADGSPVAMVVRYEHASEERDAFLAQALNQFAERSKRRLDHEHVTRRSRT